MKELVEKLNLINVYYKKRIDSDRSGYQITELLEEFEDEFKKCAPHEIFNADLDTYTSYVEPTCGSETIQKRIEDAENRYTMKKWLSKSFFEWFPKYRFLEKYDLSDYPKLNNELNYMNELCYGVLQMINTYEQNLANKYK